MSVRKKRFASNAGRSIARLKKIGFASSMKRREPDESGAALLARITRRRTEILAFVGGSPTDYEEERSFLSPKGFRRLSQELQLLGGGSPPTVSILRSCLHFY